MEQAVIRKFRNNLRWLERIVDVHLRRDTCCHGVSIAQCHTLLTVEQLGRPSLGELAEGLDLDKSTLSRTVEGLVKGGLLEREVDADDRRSIRISLSESGREVCDGINRSNDERYGSILTAIDREPAEVVEIFAELVQAMALSEPDSKQCVIEGAGRT